MEAQKAELFNVKKEHEELIEICTTLEKELEESKKTINNYAEQVNNILNFIK